MTFGFLSSTRINGPYTWTEGRLSANWEPLGWLNGGVNMSVNSFTTSFGWVLNIHPRASTSSSAWITYWASRARRAYH